MRFLSVPLVLALVPLAFAQNPGVVVDNEYVRVLSIVDPPASKPGRLHDHKNNRVMIHLDAAEIQLKHEDGRVEDQHWKAGDIAWSPAGGFHTSQNLSGKPVRIIHIELRQPAPVSKGSGARKGSAVINNAQVRVYRGSKAPAKGNYVAIDTAAAVIRWNKLPEGPGPFLIAELK